MADPFESYSPSLTAPAENMATVTPSDSTLFTNRPRGVYVGTSGDVSMQMTNGATVVKNLVAGVTHAFRPLRINATGTTAQDIVIVW